ncbi:MAG: hypothetical protein GXP02_10410 [Alphaproteobacteria bacterium]|nr:hypothetical protein [Alphaproteobacteria bacterium]
MTPHPVPAWKSCRHAKGEDDADTLVKKRDVSSQEETGISSYGDGGFRLGEQRCNGSILITPRGYYPWLVADGISRESLRQVIEQRQDIDILLVGTGETMVFIHKELRAALATDNIAVEVMATGAAARTYNILLAEGRKVAAALIATD